MEHMLGRLSQDDLVGSTAGFDEEDGVVQGLPCETRWVGHQAGWKPVIMGSLVGMGLFAVGTLFALRTLLLPDTAITLEAITEQGEPQILQKVTECSVTTTQNCMLSQCCHDYGMQCYAKNESWAACLKSCEKGNHLEGGDGPWRCNKLGYRRKCHMGLACVP